MPAPLDVVPVPVDAAISALTGPLSLVSGAAGVVASELEVAVAAHLQALRTSGLVLVRIPADEEHRDALQAVLPEVDVADPGEGDVRDWFSRYMSAERTFGRAGQHLAATGLVQVSRDSVVSRDGRSRTLTRFAAHLDFPDLPASIARVGCWAETPTLSPDEALVRGTPYFSVARLRRGAPPWSIASLGRHQKIVEYVVQGGPGSAADSVAWMAAQVRLNQAAVRCRELRDVKILELQDAPAVSSGLLARPDLFSKSFICDGDGVLVVERGAVAVGAVGVLEAVSTRFPSGAMLFRDPLTQLPALSSGSADLGAEE